MPKVGATEAATEEFRSQARAFILGGRRDELKRLYANLTARARI